MRRWAILFSIILLTAFLPSVYSLPSYIQKTISGSHPYGVLISQSNVRISEIKLVLKGASLDYGVLIKGSNVSIGKIEIVGSGYVRYVVAISKAGNVRIGSVIVRGPRASYLFHLFQAWGTILLNGSSGSYASTAFNVYYSSPTLFKTISISIYNSSFSKGSILDIYCRQAIIPTTEYRVLLKMKNVSFRTSGSDEPLFLSSNVPTKVYLENCSLISHAPSIEVFESSYFKLYLISSNLSSKECGIEVIDSFFVSIYVMSSSTISAPKYITASSNSVVACYTKNPAEMSKRSSPSVSFYLISGKKYVPWHPKIRELINLTDVPQAAGILATILVVNIIGLMLTRIGKKY